MSIVTFDGPLRQLAVAVHAVPKALPVMTMLRAQWADLIVMSYRRT